VQNLNHYSKCVVNSILLSKLNVLNLQSIPELQKLSFFFVISTKVFKSNEYLFYIMVSLIFNGTLVKKKNQVRKISIFNIVLIKKVESFLARFVSFYLPLVDYDDIVISKGIALNAVKNNMLVFRLNYFTFPVIPELDFIYNEYPMIRKFISTYRLQLDIYLKLSHAVKDTGDFLLRMHRLPCRLFLKKVNSVM